MSKHDAEYIMTRMAYAVGLQFRTAYWQSKGYKLKHDDDSRPTLGKVIE